MNRKNFITKAGLTFGTASFMSTISQASIVNNFSNEWEAIRAQFPSMGYDQANHSAI